MTVDPRLAPWMDVLRAPGGGAPLAVDGGALVAAGGERFPLTADGVPLFAAEATTPASRAQQVHYDRIADAYAEALALPQTRAYMACLDQAVHAAWPARGVDRMLELCCGLGEAVALLEGRYRQALALDLSPGMLARAVARHRSLPCAFVQGDALSVPLADESVDAVAILGGIHHVPDRARLFAEVARVLRPGGRLVFREPVSDWAVWRWLRAVVYRLSPLLDAEHEAPLERRRTLPELERAGLACTRWERHGLVGFLAFMNAEVLKVNALFSRLPGVQRLVGAVAACDRALLRLPGVRRAGLIVVGVAEKPA